MQLFYCSHYEILFNTHFSFYRIPSMLQLGDKVLNKTPPSVNVTTIPGEKEPPVNEMIPGEREAMWSDRKVRITLLLYYKVQKFPYGLCFECLS